MYHNTPQNQESRKTQRSGRGRPEPAAETIAQSNGTIPNQAKRLRHTGSGPASGKGNSSKPADKAAAAHNFQDCTSEDVRCILRRVYSIGQRLGSETNATGVALSDVHYECALRPIGRRCKS